MLRAAGDQVRPDLGLHQDADARREMAQEAPHHEAGVVGQDRTGPRARRAGEQRAPVARPVGVMWVSRMRLVGIRRQQRLDQRLGGARFAHRHRVHHDGRAVFQQAAGRRSPGARPGGAVARFLAPAPPQAAQHQRQRQPPQPASTACVHQDAPAGARGGDHLVDARRHALSPRLTMRGDQLPSVFQRGESHRSPPSASGRPRRCGSGRCRRRPPAPPARQVTASIIDSFGSTRAFGSAAASVSASRFSPCGAPGQQHRHRRQRAAEWRSSSRRPFLGVARGAVEEHGIRPAAASRDAAGRAAAGRSRAGVDRIAQRRGRHQAPARHRMGARLDRDAAVWKTREMPS
jgi:hypothetical protein